MTSSSRLARVALLAWPLLAAPKCFDPELAPAPPDAAPPVDAAPHIDGDPLPPDASAFVPAVACEDPLEARLVVADLAYQLRCGCREASGKTCTVPRGTTVIWQFADAEEHNVASSTNGFSPSGERLTGTFAHTFDTPGTYAYECSIHTQMNGYTIVVE